MSPSETERATRAMFRTILRRLTVLVLALAVGGVVVAGLVAGPAGVWGALLGAGIAAMFMVGTAVAMLLTADKPLHVASAAGVGGWLVKMVVLFAVLLAVRDRDFYSPGAFFVVLVLAIVGSLVIEMGTMLRARIPNVEPRPRDEA